VKTALTAQEKNEIVRHALLAEAGEWNPISPTELARKINQPWCVIDGFASSAAVCPILKRIGAQKAGRGSHVKYWMPK
jgi:hypothetical protein